LTDGFAFAVVVVAAQHLAPQLAFCTCADFPHIRNYRNDNSQKNANLADQRYYGCKVHVMIPPFNIFILL
jgi:hypothetical protein